MRERPLGAMKDHVFCMNPYYSFVLTREKAGKPWTLLQYETDHVKQLRPLGAPVRNHAISIACPHVHCNFLRPLNLVVKDKGFIIKSVHADGNESRRLVRVNYEYSEKIDKRLVHHTGWMTLDPEQYWIAVDCEDTLESDGYRGHYRIQFSTIAGPRGYPLAKRVLLNLDIIDKAGTKNSSNIVTDLDLTLKKDVPEREFRMSAFGLPEPKGMEINDGGGLSLYLWLFGLTIGCFVSALLIRRLARRRATSAESQ